MMLVMTGCADSFTGGGKIKVVTSIFPIGNIIENLGGDEVEVKVLVDPGLSPHTYDPQPSDVTAVADADLVFVVGGDFDNWIQELVKDAGVSEERVVELKDFVTLRPFGEGHHHGEDESGEENKDGEVEDEDHEHAGEITDENFDPHFWLSPTRVMEMIDDITAKFKEMDPDNAALYDWENDDFMTEIDSLNEFIDTEVEKFATRKLITFHPSFGYFADDYGLEVVGTIEELAGVEPTPEKLQVLSDAIKKNNLNVIFIEPQLSSDVVEALTTDLRVQIGELDPLGGIDGRVTYQSLIRHNVIEMRTYMK